VRCPNCRASLFVDSASVVRHSVLAPRLGAGEARGAVERFLRGAEVDALLTDVETRLELHPWWVVRDARGLGDGAGPRLVRASAACALARPPRRAVEAGDDVAGDGDLLRRADTLAPEFDADEAVLRAGLPAGAPPPVLVLLHVPVWSVAFSTGGKRHIVQVDAVEGEVDAWTLPPSSTRRLDRDALTWFLGSMGLFALEAALLPGLVAPLAAFAATGGVAYLLVRAGEREPR